MASLSDVSISNSAKDIASFIDSGQKVRFSVYVKESRNKTERMVTSWDPIPSDTD